MPPKRPKNRRGKSPKSSKPTPERGRPPHGLRIVGGRFRGRKLAYHGDRSVRPMKDRTREALFNLLGPAVRGTHAIDLFAGTGALGLEALSRGADRATFVERHHPTAATLRANIAALEVEPVSRVAVADTFYFFSQQPDLGPEPWTVFCSPPYDCYEQQREALVALLGGLMETAPVESLFSVEADRRFDFSQLPDADKWDVRAYPPALIGVYRLA